MLRAGLRQHNHAFHKKDYLHRAVSVSFPGTWTTLPANAAHSNSQLLMQHGHRTRLTAAKADTGYWTLAEPYTLEVEVKKSQFIATAWPVTSAAEALAKIHEASDPSATHNCWAFKVAGNARSNDDGEPSGTAGKPILGAIEGDGLDGVAVLVIRHFGGIKLGTGGLVRAYGGAARDCVRAATKAFVKQKVELSLETPFECLGTVYNMLSKYGATAGEEQYTARGKVQLSLTADADQAEALQQAIADATSGKVQPELVTAEQ
eukprot:GHUV01005970.1.p1 GENE.GHUV01005970.1~~GHUV01005970.1.p1  ORF type:complete len:262 (+),score=81.30 GHUV01005970.1:149-934(+)